MWNDILHCREIIVMFQKKSLINASLSLIKWSPSQQHETKFAQVGSTELV